MNVANREIQRPLNLNFMRLGRGQQFDLDQGI